MPLQTRIIAFQAEALKLANVTTNGFHERDSAELQSNFDAYEQSKSLFNENYQVLSQILRNNH